MLAAPWFLAVVGLVIHVVMAFLMIRPVLNQKPVPAETAAAESAPPPPPPPAPPKPVWNFRTEAVDELITELKNERTSLLEEQKDLAALKMQIDAERGEVERIKADVTRLREALDARVVEVQEFERTNLKKLVQTYTTMNPVEAVLIFRELEEDTVVKILSEMKTERVALLMAQMVNIKDTGTGAPEDSPSRRAARISDKLRLMKVLKKEAAQ